MKYNNKNQLFMMIIRVVLGVVFIYASIDKILFPARFAEIIYHYKVLPIEMLNIIAILIPWLEAGLGLLLIFDIWTDMASLILGVLSFVFILLIVSAMIRGLNIQCGCFSLDNKESVVGTQRIIEDLIITVGCFILFFYYSRLKPLLT